LTGHTIAIKHCNFFLIYLPFLFSEQITIFQLYHKGLDLALRSSEREPNTGQFNMQKIPTGHMTSASQETWSTAFATVTAELNRDRMPLNSTP
jgi:hypothetical protein